MTALEAALRIGAGLARTLAFEQLDHLQHDEELHCLHHHGDRDPARPAIARVAIRQSPWPSTRPASRAVPTSTSRLKLGVALTLNEQSTQDETQLNLPRSDSTVAAFARAHRNGRWARRPP